MFDYELQCMYREHITDNTTDYVITLLTSVSGFCSNVQNPQKHFSYTEQKYTQAKNMNCNVSCENGCACQ